ncbi:MAG: hypothetical protein U0744_05905 [Gemmataceae bacterium]
MKPDAAREALIAKARSRHLRRHPKHEKPKPDGDGLLAHVQSAVADAAQAVSRIALVAVEAVKGAVAGG